MGEPTVKKVTLTGIRNEFRSALEDEIEAAQKKSLSGAIPLSNGRRIARNADRHQYLFKLDSELFVPTDSPVDLILQGRPPITATIISVEALNLTLSVAEDLVDLTPPGKWSEMAECATGVDEFSAEEISEMSDRETTRDLTTGSRSTGARLIRKALSLGFSEFSDSIN